MTPPLVRPIPKLTTPGSAAAFLAVATSQLGYREGSNNDNAFGLWYGLNHEAWCAEKISWDAFFSGCKGLIPKAAFTEAMAQWFMERDQWIDNDSDVKPGDIGFIWDQSMVSKDRPHGIHHVFAAQKEIETSKILTVEGNTNDNGSSQGNGVYALKRTRTRIRGFGRPKYVKPPTPPKPVKTITDIAKEVIAGKWDIGSARVMLLTKAGYVPATIQTEVNRILKG